MSSNESDSTLIVDPSEYETVALARLRESDERATDPRRSVIRVIAHAERPLSHGEIVKRLAQSGRAADKNSTSRALALLQRLGLIIRTEQGWVPFMGTNASATLAVRDRAGRYRIRPLPEEIAEGLRGTVDSDPSAVIRVEITLPNDGPGETEENDVGED
jgi:hypothetical protein